MAQEQVAHQRSQVANGELGSRIWGELRQGPLGCDNPRRWRQWLTRVRAAVCPLAWAFSSVVLYLTLSIIITHDKSPCCRLGLPCLVISLLLSRHILPTGVSYHLAN
jgi:hypothetical protein